MGTSLCLIEKYYRVLECRFTGVYNRPRATVGPMQDPCQREKHPPLPRPVPLARYLLLTRAG
jgi:hypothetical protein